MPIIGLTDRGLSFPEIGQIRKGIKEQRTRKDGTSYEVPVDLKYFRVEFDQRETETADRFKKHYGDEPESINIILPFDEIERCWDAWLEAYTAGRMVARADGRRFTYLIDTDTGDIIVRNGEPFTPYEEGKPVGKDYEGKAVFAKPVGRLKIIVPELARAAYLTLSTTSIHDIANISAQLEAFKRLNQGVIKGIPLVLRRRPKKITVPKKDGQRVRMEKWMLSIEADPTWVRAKLLEVKSLALPSDEFNLLPEGEEVEGVILADYNGAEFEEGEILQPITRLSLETARDVTNRDGVKYGDLDREKLVHMWGSLKKSLNTDDLSPEEREGREYKLDAIQVILVSEEGEE